MYSRFHRSFSALLGGLLGILISGCLTSGASGGASGAPPNWVTDKDSMYPADRFLAEVGEGDSLKAAKSNAAGAIAGIFRTRVTVDSTIRTRYTEISGADGSNLGMVSQTDFDQSIGQSADESLSNMKFGESWQDEMGRVYTVAYLDRLETGNLYRGRILENDERVTELMERAESQNEGLRRYAFLDAAYVTAEISRVILQQLEIINMPMARSVLQGYDLGDLRAERADQAVSLDIQAVVSGDEGGPIPGVLTDWLTQKGFSVSPRGDILVSAVIGVTPLELDNGYENLSWELQLDLIDSGGYAAVSLSRQNRSSGVSESAARARMYQDITETIQRDFEVSFNAYLNSFLEK